MQSLHSCCSASLGKPAIDLRACLPYSMHRQRTEMTCIKMSWARSCQAPFPQLALSEQLVVHGVDAADHCHEHETRAQGNDGEGHHPLGCWVPDRSIIIDQTLSHLTNHLISFFESFENLREHVTSQYLRPLRSSLASARNLLMLASWRLAKLTPLPGLFSRPQALRSNILHP